MAKIQPTDTAFKPVDDAAPVARVATTHATMEGFAPVVGAGTRGDPVPTMSPCPPFYLAARADRLTIVGDRIAPLLKTIPLQDGVNAVQVVRDRNDKITRIDAGQARATAEDRGWIVIGHLQIPQAHKTKHPAGYLYHPVGRPDVSLSIYERCYVGSSTIRRDDVAYGEFCEWLYDAGIVPPPPMYALEALAERLSAVAAGLADRAKKHSAMAPDADEAARQLAVVRRAIVAGELTEATHAASDVAIA